MSAFDGLDVTPSTSPTKKGVAGTYLDDGKFLQAVQMAIRVGGLSYDLSSGPGASDLGTIRAILASDDPAVVELANILNALQGTLTVTSGSSSDVVQNTPTISTSVYVDGYVLGGLQAITVSAKGQIKSAQCVMKSGSFIGTIDLLVFNANPSASTVTDHGAFALAAVDAAKLVGVLHLTDWTLLSGALASVQTLDTVLPYEFGSTTMYLVAVVHGTPTFTATTDAVFSIGMTQ